MKKTIGVLGGMGPEASAYFYGLLTKHTRAARDQEHIPIIIWSDPRVPDRTEAILGKGPSPLPRLIAGARGLRRAGANFLVIPCLTAHYFLEELRKASAIPILSLLEETARFIRRRHPRLGCAGLLASSGTVRSGLFQKALAAAGIRVLVPTESEQKKVMASIYGRQGIKAGVTAGKPRTLLRGVARQLIRRGAQAIIAGCTEIPLALRPADLAVPFLDPMDIAARSCIRRAGFPLREPKREEQIYTLTSRSRSHI
jgi:aspartate racemase